MNGIIKKFAFATVAFTLIMACSNPKTEHKGKEYTAQYVCPMHCEGSGSDSAGQCPVCGMDYVKNPDHKHTDTIH